MWGKVRYALAVLLLAFGVTLSDGLGGNVTVLKFRVDPSTSNFIAHAHRGGLAWFKGHDHYIAVRGYAGEASLTLDVLQPASLTMAVQADSVEETGAHFTAPQKAIIKKELDDIVLEPEKYPSINFKSTNITGRFKDGRYEVEITGDLSLHGVTRRVTIPAAVTVNGNILNAKGSFDISRSEFNVEATSAFHGMVRVKDNVTIEFDINACRI